MFQPRPLEMLKPQKSWWYGIPTKCVEASPLRQGAPAKMQALTLPPWSTCPGIITDSSRSLLP
jgi:hypothetical protein